MEDLVQRFRVSAVGRLVPAEWLNETRLGTAVFIIFAAVSFALLGHRSLWLDEFYTIDFSSPDTSYLTALTKRIATDPSLPPLYYSLVHFWLQLFGSGEAALRALNFIGVGILGFAMIYSRTLPWAGRVWLPFWVLLLTSRFAWDFVWEGRSYFLLFAGATLLCIYLVDLLSRMDKGETIDRRLLISSCLTAYLLGTLHYFGLLFAGSALFVVFAVALFKRYRAAATGAFVTGALILVSNGLWIAHSVPKSAIGRAFWLTFDPVTAVTGFLIYSFSNNLLIVALASFALYGTWRALREDLPLKGLIALGGLTFGAAFLVSLLEMPLLLYRYLIVLAPPLLLIVARLLAAAPHPWILPAALASALVISLPIAVGRSLPSRQDWRGAATYLDSQYPGECGQAVIMAPYRYERFMAGRYAAHGRDWTFVPIEQGAVDAVLASPCPVVAWVSNMDLENSDTAVMALNWKGTPIKLIHFEAVSLAVKK